MADRGAGRTSGFGGGEAISPTSAARVPLRYPPEARSYCESAASYPRPCNSFHPDGTH